MTELDWSDFLAAFGVIDHRIARSAGDAQVLSDEMLASNFGPTVAKWGEEAGRIGRDLGDLLEVIERVRPDANADTDVIPLASIAEPTPLAAELLDIARRCEELACQPGIAAELRLLAARCE